MAAEIDVRAAQAALSRGAPLLDVRETWEWEEVRIPGAVLIPMGEVPARLAEVPEDGEVLVHCRSGARSAAVVDWLAANGRPGAVNVAGGIIAWSSAGLPTEEGPPTDRR